MTTKPTLQPIEPAAETNSETAAAPDPFAPENLRLSQSFNEMVGVKKILTYGAGAQARRARFCARASRS